MKKDSIDNPFPSVYELLHSLLFAFESIAMIVWEVRSGETSNKNVETLFTVAGLV